MENNNEILKKFLEYRQLCNKSQSTIKLDSIVISEFRRFTKDKPFGDVTEQETKGFIKKQKALGTRTSYGTRLIIFFRWLNKLKKRQRPKIMEWFEFPTAALIRRNKDPDVKKFLIEDDEYDKIQQNIGHDPKWSALFESLYLSGARPNEVNQMNVGDVDIEENVITIRESKTIARKVPLPESPKMLIRWLEYHPKKDDKNAPLFPSDHHGHHANRMATTAINGKLSVIIRQTGIKSTLTPHCFRKTRATIMFSSRNPIYDDSEIAKYFGWKAHTISDRREQYDLRNFDDLKEKIQGNIPKAETYDVIKHERDKYEKMASKYKSLESNNKHLINLVNSLEIKIDDMVHNREQELEKAERTEITNQEYTKKLAKDYPGEYAQLVKTVKLLNKKLGILPL